MRVHLVHKSINLRPEVWRRLRLNAELSGAALRDYLTYVIEQAEPIAETDPAGRQKLATARAANQAARAGGNQEACQ